MESRSRSRRKRSLPQTTAATAATTPAKAQRLSGCCRAEVRKPDGTVETTRTESDGTSQPGLATCRIVLGVPWMFHNLPHVPFVKSPPRKLAGTRYLFDLLQSIPFFPHVVRDS